LRAYGGKIFCLDAHLARLADSCAGIGKPPPFETDALARWVKAALLKSACPDAMIRCSLHWKNELEGAWLVIIRKFLGYPRRWYETGVSLSTTVVKRWTLRAQNPQIKSSVYMNGVLAELDGRTADQHEFIFLNEAAAVAEGSVSNLFIVKTKRLLTPAVSSGILRGVTRAAVIDLAKKSGLPVVETILSRHDFYSADECFMANTSSEVLPVVSVDTRRIADGRPGLITETLARDFKKYVTEKLG